MQYVLELFIWQNKFFIENSLSHLIFEWLICGLEPLGQLCVVVNCILGFSIWTLEVLFPFSMDGVAEGLTVVHRCVIVESYVQAGFCTLQVDQGVHTFYGRWP